MLSMQKDQTESFSSLGPDFALIDFCTYGLVSSIIGSLNNVSSLSLCWG
jgi:hypothetical protein